MSIENKDTEQQLADNFRLVARRYFESMYPPTSSSNRGQFLTEEYTSLQEEFNIAMSDIPKPLRDQICEEEKQRALRLPGSMFLTEQAFEKFKQSFVGVRLAYYSSREEMEQSSRGASGEFFGVFDPDGIRQYGFFENAQFAIASKTIEGYEHEVGATAFRYETDENGDKSIYVMYQRGYSVPGLGLGMLQEIIERAKSEGCASIRLVTSKIPYGLANLGFKYVPKLGYYGTAFYQLNIDQNS